MSLTVSDLMSRVSDDIMRTISSTSTDPTLAKALRYYNRVIDSIVQICVSQKSEVGRFLAFLSTTDGTAEYTTYKDTIYALDKWGYVLETYAKNEMELISEKDSMGYGFATTQESEPSAYYLNSKNYIVLCPTPDTTYTVKIPYWKKHTDVAALTYSMTAATQANPCVITVASHPLQTDDRVYIDSVVGMTQLNGSFYDVTRVDSTQFSLQGINSTAYTAWSSAGTIYPVVPFNGLFDNIITEMVVLLLQNRDEYDQPFETGYIQQLTSMVMAVLNQRKKNFSLSFKGYNG